VNTTCSLWARVLSSFTRVETSSDLPYLEISEIQSTAVNVLENNHTRAMRTSDQYIKRIIDQPEFRAVLQFESSD
jgi:hypothetical protein